MQAATSGTLSTTDERMPMAPAMVNTSWTFLSSQSAMSVSTPPVCNAPTAIRMPRKKRIVGMSMCLRTLDTRGWIDSSMLRMLRLRS